VYPRCPVISTENKRSEGNGKWFPAVPIDRRCRRIGIVGSSRRGKPFFEQLFLCSVLFRRKANHDGAPYSRSRPHNLPPSLANPPQNERCSKYAGGTLVLNLVYKEEDGCRMLKASVARRGLRLSLQEPLYDMDV